MGMALPQVEYEFCTACGNEVRFLNPVTGWCNDCSVDHTDQAVCESCGNEFTRYQSSRKTCLQCRRDEWLERNADSIERAIADGLTLIKAIVKVSDDNRPVCAKCGDPIKQGTQGRTNFCKKRDACRRASIRYSAYKKRNHMSHDDALRKALHGNDPKTSEADSSGILE